MGNNQSSISVKEARELITDAGFTPQKISSLNSSLASYDLNNDGQLELTDLTDIPQLAENPLCSRFFRVFDINRDGLISLTELILGISKLSSTTDYYHKVKFVFDIFDVQEDGYLSNGEIFEVLKLMVANNLTDAQLQQLIDRTIILYDTDNDGLLSFQEFQDCVSKLGLTDRINIPV